ncbi:hypothetical protein BD626DRAFT_453114 [Schizophyllum amplum]|uniref:C2H2-type domain-containing protein n=1 Tax=Schizophyllum amplum TaxID=97359 RepID=A0A550CM75_9AGAR|nr:hypothetical protein BD626DRAFT_453114 [Auriculariopsis ampla]
MGRLRRSRAHHARRDVHRAARTRVRSKDLDQIQLIDLDPKNRARLEAQELDYEKPGLAQHYCVECAKYYETDTALQSHWRSKLHKRRCKRLAEPAYTIEEAEMAAGLGREPRRARPEPVTMETDGAGTSAAGAGEATTAWSVQIAPGPRMHSSQAEAFSYVACCRCRVALLMLLICILS